MSSVTAQPVAPSIVRPGPLPGEEAAVVLNAVSWAGYETLLREVGESAARLTYDGGRLEITMPGKRHEELKKLVAQLVDMLLVRKRIRYATLGNMTWFREDRLRGLESDDCYYIGEHARSLRGKRSMDLSVDPPPDLAIEVEVTASSVNKLGVYAGLGVPEVWRIAADGSVRAFRLNPGGVYDAVTASVILPEMPLPLLEEHLRLLDAIGHAEVVWRFEDRLPELVKRT